MSAYGDYLNPSRISRKVLGLKSENTHHVQTHNPSSANPGETLYVRIPKLDKSTVIVPNSLMLTFDFIISGHAGNYMVNNLGNNISSHDIIKIGGETIYDLTNCHLFYTYRDLWLTSMQRENSVFQGIHNSKKLSKLRAGHTKETTPDGSTEKDIQDGTEIGQRNAIFDAYGKRFCKPLNFELFSRHAPFYPYAIDADIVYEITINEIANVVQASEKANWNFELKNICLEYDTVSDTTLTRHIADSYSIGTYYLYNYITHFKTVELLQTSGILNININVPRRSVTGVLFIFENSPRTGSRNSELFVNPGIEKVVISVEGISHKIYAQGLKTHNLWFEIRKYFMSEGQKEFGDTDMSEYKYYLNRFALWIDFRSTQDNNLHGSGLRLANTRDGIQLEITPKTLTGDYKAHVFIVADAQLNISNNQLQSVTF